jgi:hypothetical protein
LGKTCISLKLFTQFFTQSPGSKRYIIQPPLNPTHNQRDNISDLRIIQRPALFDSMPLLNAPPATGGGGMLGDEKRMPSHRGLFSVILGKIKGNPGIYKLKCVLFDGFETFGGNLIPVFFG